MEFPKQEYWSGLPCPPPGDLPNPRIEPAVPVSPALAGRFFSAEPPWKPSSISWYFSKWGLPSTTTSDPGGQPGGGETTEQGGTSSWRNGRNRNIKFCSTMTNKACYQQLADQPPETYSPFALCQRHSEENLWNPESQHRLESRYWTT